MDHLTPEQLQRYLAGDLHLEESTEVEGHLTRCSRCESLLAAIAADDAALSDALALSSEELEWVGAQDLRPAVARRLAPWFLQPAGMLLLLAMAATAGLMMSQTTALLGRWVGWNGPVDAALSILELVLRLTWRLFEYIGASGPLVALILVLTGLWILRRKMSRA